MTPLENLQIAIAIVAIVCGVLSFGVYIIHSLKPPAQAAAQKASGVAQTVQEKVGVTPAEVTDLVKALAALSESLAKAGPALWSMIGAALFLLIAAVSAGVLHGKPPAAPQTGGAGASAAGRTSGGDPSVGGAPKLPQTPESKIEPANGGPTSARPAATALS
ncbi:hypothetical protein [Phenylobacterium sp.]|uniref:hypothetical protein n=1 Tax=Phenylobacterium sp. TaxID=1871053 RepID=UPI003D2780C3